jgi:hypothetical protein
MSAHGGPNIVEDGLVLALDAANIKSFRGIPTVNYLSNPTQTFNAGEFYQYYDLRPIFETYGLVPYSLSFEARGNIPGYCLVYMQNGSYTKYAFVSTVIDLTTDWKLYTFENITPSGPTSAWQQNTPGDNRAMLATYTIYGTGRNPQIRNMQLELGTVATPFVDGTRGTTVATGGGWADRSGTGNNGELVNGPTYNSSNGGSIVFDGVNEYVNISTFTNKPLTQITCESWIYPNKPSIGGTIRGGAISSTNSMYIGIIDSVDGGNTFAMHWANQTTNSRVYNWNGNIPNNQWSFLIGTYDGTTMKAYLNGIQIWSEAQTGTIPDATYVVGTYGPALTDGVHNFQGRISGAKIYNRALTTAEILQNYNATKGRYGL